MNGISALTPKEEQCVRRLLGVHRKRVNLRMRRLEALAKIRLIDNISITIDHVNPHRAALLARLDGIRSEGSLILVNIDGALRFFAAIEEILLKAMGLWRL